MERTEMRETETEETASVERRNEDGGGNPEDGDGRRGLYCDVPERDRRNERRILAWMVPWMLSWLAVDVALERGWLTTGWLAVVAAVVSVVFGVATVLAYRRYLQTADELHRKIHMEALAVAFGVGVVGGTGLWLLRQAGVAVEPALLHLLVAMLLTHGITVLVGLRRYS